MSLRSFARRLTECFLPARRSRSRPALRPWGGDFEPLEGRRLLSGSTFVVTNLSGDPSVGGSLPNAVALANAQPGSSIVFATNPGTITLNSTLVLKASVRITGPGVNQLTLQSSSSYIIAVSPGVQSASISNLTLSGSNTFNMQGGLDNAGALTLSSCNLLDNNGAHGAIYNEARGSMTMTGCTVTGANLAVFEAIDNAGTLAMATCTLSNNSGVNGAIFNETGAALRMSACTLSTNSGSQAGAINSLGALTASNSVFLGNTATTGAGGISSSGPLTLSNCTVANNTGAAAGGLSITGPAVVNSNSIIANNTGTQFAGGVIVFPNGSLRATNSFIGKNSGVLGGGLAVNQNARLSLTSCTISGNSSSAFGGGIYDAGGTVGVSHSTIVQNSAGSGGGLYVGFGGPLPLLNYSTILGNFSGSPPHTTPSDIAGTVDPNSSYNLIGPGGSGGLKNGVNHNVVQGQAPHPGAFLPFFPFRRVHTDHPTA